MCTTRSHFTSLPSLLLVILISSHNNASINALNIAVTGATGRVGRLVVDNCLKSGHDVTAIVRNVDKAKDLLSNMAATTSDRVTIRQLDFADLAISDSSSKLVGDAFDGVDQVIWCASGFVDVPDNDGEGDVKKMKKESLDVIGMTHLLPVLSTPPMLGRSSESDHTSPSAPAFIMLSSAGVTRPGWDDAKKEKFAGCADIPIVRMNPGGILGKKVVAEDMLRHQESNVIPYCIVRPTALKFEDEEWPRGRTLFSQGDVAVGRMNANDLASNLVSLLNEPCATGKTFECVTVVGYPPTNSLSPVLERLAADSVINYDSESVYTAFQLMQQLLPGENQDATRLEMGRTYEQVDRGEVSARVRGAAATEREKELAGSVVNANEEKTDFFSTIKNMFAGSSS